MLVNSLHEFLMVQFVYASFPENNVRLLLLLVFAKGLEVQWKRLCGISQLHTPAKELGKLAYTKSSKHPRKQVAKILLDDLKYPIHSLIHPSHGFPLLISICSFISVAINYYELQ